MSAPHTEFYEAVDANDINKVKSLIDAGTVDINARFLENKARTALHIACLRGYDELAKLLVDSYKADVNIADLNDDLAIDLAADSYRPKIVKFLNDRNSKSLKNATRILNDISTDDFFEAVSSNDISRVESMLDSNTVSVTAKDTGDYSRTALHVASQKGYIDLVRVLVDKYKADVNIDDEIGELPIHNAADAGHIDIVKFLAERKSNGLKDVQDLLET